MIATREQLHRLVDQLPESEMATAQRVLEALTAVANDPFLEMLHNAAKDDEELTPDEEALVEEGREQLRRGEGRSLDAIRHFYGCRVAVVALHNSLETPLCSPRRRGDGGVNSALPRYRVELPVAG